MLKLIQSLFSRSTLKDQIEASTCETSLSLEEVTAVGILPFRIAEHLSSTDSLPVLDWSYAQAWVETIPDVEDRARAWNHLEHAWLKHLQQALGPAYSLRQAGDSMLLSTLETRTANATLQYVSKTLQRVMRVLDGIAETSDWGNDILIVFDDEETYYRYVSHYYPGEGDFAASSGMHINSGCSHFVTVKADLRAIEPIIAHEMTHSCLSHLPIPAWLNEGLAVNTEQRLSPSGSSILTPQQMHAKHLAFWGNIEIQQFWSGKSFLRNDDGNMLSYDLARILVSQLSSDWHAFRDFVLNADMADGGESAAIEYLNRDLGALACTILERDFEAAWTPHPEAWDEAPEAGAF